MIASEYQQRQPDQGTTTEVGSLTTFLLPGTNTSPLPFADGVAFSAFSGIHVVFSSGWGFWDCVSYRT